MFKVTDFDRTQIDLWHDVVELVEHPSKEVPLGHGMEFRRIFRLLPENVPLEFDVLTEASDSETQNQHFTGKLVSLRWAKISVRITILLPKMTSFCPDFDTVV